MLVIEGKNNKSRILENWIRKEYMGDKLAIIDKHNIPAFSLIDNVGHYKVSATIEELVDEFKSEASRSFLSRFDWIVFYVNISRDELELFQELDRIIPQNIIVTVHNDSRGLTGKYFL